MSAILKGVVLGLANLVAIGLGLGMVNSGHGMFAAIPLVLIFGGAPGLIAGAIIGAIAGANRDRPTRARQVTLVVVALVACLAITAGLGMLVFAPIAVLPTLFSALVLERWTRRGSDLR
jgi:uncharacterized membrane protein